MFWGTTPALDFQEKYKLHYKSPEELNILIVGGADARHIIKTMSKYYQHEAIKINFYVMETCMELIGRQMLLLNIALESAEQIGLMQKIKIFMEIYGNSLMRPAIAKYLISKSKQLVNMITNLEYCYNMMQNVNLDGLKYKERDYLEILFKYWSASDPLNISEIWDRRIRNSLGIRYDAKLGVFDWDLHMRLHSAGAKQICTQEYKHWRDTGVAFTWLDSDVSKPNRTLVAGVVPSGEKFVHHGYLGDIISGPFIAYGLECKDKEMLKKTNHMNINRATDVTEYNLMHMFFELLNKEECSYKNYSNMKMGTLVIDLPNSRIIENQMILDEYELKQIVDAKRPSIYIENIKINFVSLSMLQSMIHKEKFKNLFNIIYFSNLLIDKIDSTVIDFISSVNCLFIIENQNYIPSIRGEQLDELASKISNKVSSIKHATALSFDPKKDSYAIYLI